MATKAQLESRKKNFTIFRLKGAEAMFRNIYTKYDLLGARQCMWKCRDMVRDLKLMK